MTLKEWHLFLTGALTKAAFDNAAQEAKWLLVGALEKDTTFLLLNPSYVPSDKEKERLKEWLQRRLKGEPLSRIKGIREFWSLPFHLNEQTLDPRPETEILVEGVLKWVGERRASSWRILDLGTGSGCLLIGLLHELSQATGVGVDISEAAVRMAQENASMNGVGERSTFLQGNWTEGLEGSFDIIVSNPPYIPLTEAQDLGKGVVPFDPPVALFGGEDGLDCYRILAQQLKSYLKEEGLVMLEMGSTQRQAITDLFEAAGFKVLYVLKDLAGLERVLSLTI